MLRLLLRLVLVLMLAGMVLAACGGDGTPNVKADDVESAVRMARLAEVGYVQRFSHIDDVIDPAEFPGFVCTPQAVWEASDGSEGFEVDDSMLGALATFVAMCPGVHPGDVIGSQTDALPDDMDTTRPLRRQRLELLLTHEVMAMYEIAKG